jgi:hypothetical protein
MAAKDSKPGFGMLEALRDLDPDFLRIVEQGLRSSEEKQWLETATAISRGDRSWERFFLQKVSTEPRALCWMIAAARYETWTCGSNPAPWLRSVFEGIPRISRLLSELQEIPDPWVSRMAEWGQRILDGRDKWVGGSP